MKILKLFATVLLVAISTQLLSQTYITSNTTWNTNQGGLGDIYIQNGATLTINSGVTLTMEPNSHIYVFPESKLTANGATITSLLPKSWHGIYAAGLGSNYDQLYFLNPNNEKQPEISLTNCTINNMTEGIQNALNGNSGGIIKLLRCQFNGCTIGVRFYEYIHHRNTSTIARDLSYIRNSTFNNTQGSQSIGVALKKVMGVKIEGNSFNNNYTAIYGEYATFYVNNYYSGSYYNQTFVSPAIFNSCVYGVRTLGSNALTGKVIVKNASFVSNYRSISALNSNNLEVYSNTITLQQISTYPQIVGIYLENCPSFYLENNNVSATGYNNSFPINTWGIVAHNSGGNNNKFYRNTVSNCEYNIVGQESNRGAVGMSGLQFICNNLSQTSAIGTDNTYYMAALTTQPNNPLHGINDWQVGGAFNNSLNQFDFSSSAYNEIPNRSLPTGSKYDFLNEHIRLPYDIHYKNPFNKYPLSQVLESNTFIPTYNYYGDYIWVIDEANSFSNQCPNTVPLPFPTSTQYYDVSDLLITTESSYSSLKSIFESYENNGDHQFMLNQVNGMNIYNFTIVYYYLMNYHPSTDVIAIAVGNDILPNYMCADILITNSYGIKSQLVRDMLNNRQNPLTTLQMASIITASQSQSQYESYYLELATLRTQINSLSMEKTNYFYNTESEEIDVDGVINSLIDNNNFYSSVSLMLYYFETGNMTFAEEAYNDALNMEETSTEEYNGLENLFNVLFQLYNEFSGDFSQLDQSRIDELKRLASSDNRCSGIAKALLISEFEFDFDPILLTATPNLQRIGKPKEVSKPQSSSMQIVPNPSSDFIGIIIDENYSYPLQLLVYDITGKIIINKTIDNINTILLDGLKSGFYHAEIRDANQKSFKQKLIIK